MARSHIHILGKSTASKIAAGEVIERPASVVKELLENSIDAGAKKIEIRVHDGGRREITVTDDGCGILKSELELAVQKHATSKISELKDLDKLSTLGFRGEALSSVSAVSKLDITSRAREENTGVGSGVLMEGTDIKKLYEKAMPKGTIIKVKDLFFNTPARRKFLKTARAEVARIEEIVIAQAIANPSVAISLYSDNKQRIIAPRSRHVRERLSYIFGPGLVKSLKRIEKRSAAGSVSGFIGDPASASKTQPVSFIFVNFRAVDSREMVSAVMAGYGPRVMKGRYPPMIIFIKCDQSGLDVNVHPSKLKVKFASPDAIKEMIAGAVLTALETSSQVRRITPVSVPASARKSDAAFASSIQAISQTKLPAASHIESYAVSQRQETLIAPPDESEPVIKTKSRDTQTPAGTRVLGQLKKTYILAEDESGLVIYDQHVVHERTLYDELVTKWESGDIKSQILIDAPVVNLSAAQMEKLSVYRGALSHAGFEVEDFGRASVRVTRVPSLANRVMKKREAAAIIEEIAKTKGKSPPEPVLSIMASVACRSAIKAGDVLTIQQMTGMIEKLMRARHPYNCPHGRPVIFSISKHELDKKYGRLG